MTPNLNRYTGPILRIGAFVLLWTLGMASHYLGSIWLGAVGGLIFFVAAHLLAVRLGMGGLGGIGLRPQPGWLRQLVLGVLVGGLAIVLYVLAARLLGRYGSISFRPLAEVGSLLFGIVLNHGYVAFWEETLCRGYLIKALPGRLSPATLALLSGLVFVPFHAMKIGVVPHYFLPYWFFSGIAYAIPLLITRSLWTSVGLHWGHNVLFVLLLTSEGWMIAERGTADGWWTDYLIVGLAVVTIPLAWLAAKASAETQQRVSKRRVPSMP